MLSLTLLSRGLLAAVFGVAGIAKLSDRRGTTRTLEAFGVPKHLAKLASPALPILELAIAVALMPAVSARVGAASALVMLVVFSMAAAVVMMRGRRVECHCFGQLTTGTVGWNTLARNVILAILAISVVTVDRGDRAPGFGSLIEGVNSGQLVVLAVGAGALAVLALSGWAFVHLLRGYGRLLLRIEALERRLGLANTADVADAIEPGDRVGLQPGTVAPVLAAVDVDGRALSLTDLLDGTRSILLLFTTPYCGPCREFLPEVRSWQRRDSERLRIVIASDGPLDDIRRITGELNLSDVIVDGGQRLFKAFGATSTPSGVHIRPDGHIGGFVATGPEAIAALHARILAGDAAASAPIVTAGLTPGTPVPSLLRQALGEGPRLLADLIRTETLVVFWNPACGYCRSMRDALRQWEHRTSKTALQLVIVSAGDEASVRAEGFQSPVLLDPDFSLGRAFGIGGTPMAVLVDADARIASSVASGSEAVLALAGATG
jgi:thiol-disulfide isomerase/thioredoxin